MTTPADPYKRCQRTGPFGQCPDEKVEGTDYCPAHGGRAAAAKATRRMYDLAQAELKGVYGQMADREDVLSLREEVALCRMAIQKITNLMSSDEKFESRVAMFNNLMLTAKALVGECLKVEKAANLTVDKKTLLAFAGDTIVICTEELADVPGRQEILERIAARLVNAVQAAGETEDEVQ